MEFQECSDVVKVCIACGSCPVVRIMNELLVVSHARLEPRIGVVQCINSEMAVDPRIHELSLQSKTFFVWP